MNPDAAGEKHAPHPEDLPLDATTPAPQSGDDDVPCSDVPCSDVPGQASREQQQRRNFLGIAGYQLTMRTGWIFKTESIVMPAALDLIGGPGWLRGCLPMLNRFGQSIPPLLAWPMVKRTGLKKRILFTTTLIMGVMFWALASIWFFVGSENAWWLPALFLFLYGVFFISTGVNQLVLSTLIGKLVPTTWRGRLMLVSNTVGAISAVAFAWWLLRRWLESETAYFFGIFGVAGTCFMLAALITLRLKESDDAEPVERFGIRKLFAGAIETVSGDRDFRWLAIIAGLFGMSMTLFPHYQALARERLGIGLDYLLPWVIAQNIGVALFSIPSGTMADRFGNRLVLRSIMLLLCVAPAAALAIASYPSLGGGATFSIVYVLVGLTPVTMRLITNHALEMAPKGQQPRYLSSLSLCMALPAIVTSSLLGLLLDVTSFEVVFTIVGICIFTAWFMTWRLAEPRH